MTPANGGRFGRGVLYSANLLVSFHYFLLTFTVSAYLATFIDLEYISLVFVLGSVGSIAAFSFFAPLARRFGNFPLAVVFILLELGAVLGLAFGTTIETLLTAVFIFIVVSPLIYLNLDIFLERATGGTAHTGRTRGTFLTMQDIAMVAAPLLLGLLLVSDAYWRVYAASAVFLLAALAVILLSLRHFRDYHYHAQSLWQSAAYVLKHPKLYDIVMAQFLLRFFYAWMIIYMPVYLVRDIGFSWGHIGIIFSIMFLPFLFLELPLGKMSDGRIKERDVLLVGFAILAVTTALVPFLSFPSLVLWAALLFTNRIGAACTEIATESYFFRHVDGELADTISLFRAMRPLAFIPAAALAALTLIFLPLQWSFLVLAIVMLWGLRYALALKNGSG